MMTLYVQATRERDLNEMCRRKKKSVKGWKSDLDINFQVRTQILTEDVNFTNPFAQSANAYLVQRYYSYSPTQLSPNSTSEHNC